MRQKNAFNRREFIKKSGFSAITLAASSPFLDINNKTLWSKATKTILFQGDSITDGGRSYNKDWNHIMGQSFPYLIASRLWFDHIHSDLMFLNRGISGNTIRDLKARWQKDTLDLKPDMINILVGVNDTLGVIKNVNPTSVLQFKQDYDELLSETKSALPDVKLVLCEPFILPVGTVKDDFTRWNAELAPRQAAVKSLAEKHRALFIPLQAKFNALMQKAPANYWIWDGIHPMPAGHELIAREWIRSTHEQFSLF